MGDNLNKINVQTALGSTINKANQSISQNKLVTSNDFQISKTSLGTTIKLKRKHKPSFDSLHYIGEWNPTGSFGVNEVARVMPGKTYSVDSGSFYTPGVWICVNYVPSKVFTDKAAGYDVSWEYKRTANVNYYPQWPEPTSLPSKANPQGRYWEMLSPLPKEFIICISGEPKVHYVGAFLSGSTTG
jgi:hypothetical protein